MRAAGLLILYLLAAWYFDFWPFASGSFRPLDHRHDYHAYFYYPNDKEVYLGRTKGLSNCQVAARSFAYEKNMLSADWGYICCRISRTSPCDIKEK